MTLSKSTNRALGFTLIELMIAVTIGLVLTVVISSLFLHSRSTYGATDDASRMQENIRFAQQLLSRIVHHASYISSPNMLKDLEDAPNASGATVVFDAANPGFVATDGGTSGTPSQAQPDSFTVRYQGSGVAPGDGTVVDCLGRTVNGTQISINRFHIAPGANGNLALWCEATLNGVATNSEVVPDVQNMQLLFGVDITDRTGGAARDGSAETYVPLGTVGNMNKVVSVRVALLFRTPSPSATIVAETNRTYNLNGNAVGPYTDRVLRRVITMTISMRNRSA